MQLYDITIAPNTTRQLDAPGSYFYYYAGNAGGADSTITMRGLSSGLRIVLKPGQAFRLPRGEKETSWVLTNFSNTATILGTVVVGDGDITDNRVTGSVEVIDGGKARTMSNTSFIAIGYVAGVAAKGPCIELWNPVGSGKKIILEAIGISATTAQGFNIAFLTNTLTNPGSFGASKLSGGAFSAARIYTDNVTVSPGGIGILITNIVANVQLEKKFIEPIVLNPGNGLNIYSGSQGADLSAYFEYFED